MKNMMIIRIPKPCSENWNEMSVTGKGRSCERCQKEVIDFTGFSQTQLAAYIAANPGKTCGKFSSHQLNRNLLPHAASYSALSLPALALLAATLTVNPAHGQDNDVPQKEVVQPFSESVLLPSADNGKSDVGADSSAFIRVEGVVYNKATNEPVIMAKVVLKNGDSTLQTVMTDVDGTFAFRIAPETVYNAVAAENELAVKREMITFTAEEAKHSQMIRFYLDIIEPVMLGEVFVLSKHDQKRMARKAKRQVEKTASE